MRLLLSILMFCSTAFAQTALSGKWALSGKINAGVTSGTSYFENGLEEGDTSAWTHAYKPTGFHTVQTSVVNSGTYADRITYNVCGDSGNPDCGAAHQDDNNYVRKTLDSNVGLPGGFTEGYVRFYWRLHINAGGTLTGVQRKIVRMMQLPDGGGQGTIWWVLYWDSGSPSRLVMLLNGNQTWTASSGDIATDTWDCFEVYIKLGTIGQSDGQFTVWRNGTIVPNLQQTLDFRLTDAENLQDLWVGAQADRFNYDVIDEYHYIDDVVLSSTYIGP